MGFLYPINLFFFAAASEKTQRMLDPFLRHQVIIIITFILLSLISEPEQLGESQNPYFGIATCVLLNTASLESTHSNNMQFRPKAKWYFRPSSPMLSYYNGCFVLFNFYAARIYILKGSLQQNSMIHTNEQTLELNLKINREKIRVGIRKNKSQI